MFSVPFTLLILVCPIPPIPTAAMLSLSVGETCPWLIPKIELGAIVIPAKAAVPVFRNCLLEIFVMILFLRVYNWLRIIFL